MSIVALPSPCLLSTFAAPLSCTLTPSEALVARMARRITLQGQGRTQHRFPRQAIHYVHRSEGLEFHGLLPPTQNCISKSHEGSCILICHQLNTGGVAIHCYSVERVLYTLIE